MITHPLQLEPARLIPGGGHGTLVNFVCPSYVASQLDRKHGALDLGIFRASDLPRFDLTDQFRIDRCFTDDPAIFAGNSKPLLDAIVVNFAFALASGRPFLGHFTVHQPCTVTLFSSLDDKRLDGYLDQTAHAAEDVEVNRRGCIWDSFDDFVANIEGTLQDWRPAVVILDPTITEWTKVFEAQHLCCALATLSHRYKVTFVVSHVEQGVHSMPLVTDLDCDAALISWVQQWLLFSDCLKHGRRPVHLDIGGNMARYEPHLLELEGGDGTALKVFSVTPRDST